MTTTLIDPHALTLAADYYAEQTGDCDELVLARAIEIYLDSEEPRPAAEGAQGPARGVGSSPPRRSQEQILSEQEQIASELGLDWPHPPRRTQDEAK